MSDDRIPAPDIDRLDRARAWTGLVRDLGVIVCVPAIITVGVQLYELQGRASEAQLKASEAQLRVIESQVKVVDAQNTALRDTQYDKALALITSQKALFDQERADMARRLSVETQKFEDEKVALIDTVGLLSAKFEDEKLIFTAELKRITAENSQFRLDVENKIFEAVAKRLKNRSATARREHLEKVP